MDFVEAIADPVDDELTVVSCGPSRAGCMPPNRVRRFIIQDDLFSETQSVVVIPLTTMAVTDTVTARVPVSTASGIGRSSFAMVDKITTVRRSNLGARIGRVPVALMAEIERSLMVFLGLAA